MRPYELFNRLVAIKALHWNAFTVDDIGNIKPALAGEADGLTIGLPGAGGGEFVPVEEATLNALTTRWWPPVTSISGPFGSRAWLPFK